MPTTNRKIRSRLIQMLALIVVIAHPALTTLARDGRRVTHYLVAQTASQRVAINPVSNERQNLAFDKNREEVISPDRKYAAILVKQPERGLPAGLHLADVAPDGSFRNFRMLLPATENPHDFHWTPNSEAIAVTHGESWYTQVFLVEIAERDDRANQQSKISEVRLSNGKDRANRPAVSSDGKIAWLELRDQKNKQSFIDLMVMTKAGEQPRALVERQNITAFAFSPDGKHIAMSAHGKLTIIDATSGNQISEREYHSIEERLYAHHARKLAWSHDGREIAAILNFSGGRLMTEEGQPPMIFGDREVFIIPIAPDEKAMWFTLNEETVDVSWIAGSALPKPAP